LICFFKLPVWVLWNCRVRLELGANPAILGAMKHRARSTEQDHLLRPRLIELIVTTNLPFSEWSQVIPNPRLCKALIDRLTDQAHIITTGADSYRFRRTSAQRKAAKS
jgi:hypothetical protein